MLTRDECKKLLRGAELYPGGKLKEEQVPLCKTALLAHKFRAALERVLDCEECGRRGWLTKTDVACKFIQVLCDCRTEARKLLEESDADTGRD